VRREELLLRGAALLLEDATAEEKSCSVGERLWACPDCKKDPDGKCQAQRNAEQRREAAAGLIAMGRSA